MKSVSKLKKTNKNVRSLMYIRSPVYARSLMPYKRGNITIALLVSLVVMLCGSALISMEVNSKWMSKQSYERIANRYIAESAVDLSVGLFEKHLAEQDFVMTYTRNGDGSYGIIDQYSPYLLGEIRLSNYDGNVEIEKVSTESNDYLASIGFLEFKKRQGVEFYINTFYQKENFKLSQMCIEPGFLLSSYSENSPKQSKINPIYLTVKSLYKNGEVMCSIEMSGLKIVREPFLPCEISEPASVKAWIDTSELTTKYITYQNYYMRR